MELSWDVWLYDAFKIRSPPDPTPIIKDGNILGTTTTGRRRGEAEGTRGEGETKMKTNGRRCKKCESLQTYIKFKTNERACRSCGFVEKIDVDIDNPQTKPGNHSDVLMNTSDGRANRLSGDKTVDAPRGCGNAYGFLLNKAGYKKICGIDGLCRGCKKNVVEDTEDDMVSKATGEIKE